MAQQTDMNFSPISPLSTASNSTAPTPCEELTAMKNYIRRLHTICNGKEKSVSFLRLDQGHMESDSLYQLAWSERNSQHKRKDEDDFKFPPLRKTARKTILEQPEDVIVENQFSLLSNVIIKQVSGQLTPPTANNQKSADVTNDQQRQGNNLLPPPIMMKITKTYREQVDTVKKKKYTLTLD
ncbi:hypothetical protein TNCV_810421 [Trichonephila clavipes]|uniref:Uncharacterized protein n=1 Tax=Trichonephila clavipes TaxID=2585209 RepID=A0A8X6S848_TRICX|nr:hypothetical protein TNCV_810421 [Trichonephila clavipes]